MRYPDKKGYSRRNLFYMRLFAGSYPLSVLEEMDRVEGLLVRPTVEDVQRLTDELTGIVQERVALLGGGEEGVEE